MTSGLANQRIAPRPAQARVFAPPLLVFMAALCVTAIAIAAFGRLTGIGVQRLPQSPVAEFRDLRFLDGSPGVIEVRDADDGSLVHRFNSGEGGFLRTVMRGLAHGRMARGGDNQTPFRLTLRQDGRLVIRDPVAEREVILDSFGKPNRDVFAPLLKSGATAAATQVHSAAAKTSAAGAAQLTMGEKK